MEIDHDRCRYYNVDCKITGEHCAALLGGAENMSLQKFCPAYNIKKDLAKKLQIGRVEGILKVEKSKLEAKMKELK